VQFVNPLVSVIAGEAGTTKPAANVAVTVSPAPSAPVELEVKPAVQVERAPPVCGEPPKVTPVGLVAGQIVTFEVYATAVSLLVLTLKVAPNKVLLAGLVIPAIVSVAAVPPASEHDPPLSASVIVTVVDEVEPVAEQLLKPLAGVIAGAAGIVKAELKTTVIVEPLVRAPAGVGVKPTVQVERAPPVCGEPLNVTPDGYCADTIVAVVSTCLVSTDVLSVIVFAPVEVVFVIPSSLKVAAMLLPSAHVWPVALASVIV
jgi:hypothetical protein